MPIQSFQQQNRLVANELAYSTRGRYQPLSTLTQQLSRSPFRVGASMISLIGGMHRIGIGDLSGLPGIISGAWELVQLTSSRIPCHLQRMIREVEVDMEMIQVFARANLRSLHMMGEKTRSVLDIFNTCLKAYQDDQLDAFQHTYQDVINLVEGVQEKVQKFSSPSNVLSQLKETYLNTDPLIVSPLKWSQIKNLLKSVGNNSLSSQLATDILQSLTQAGIKLHKAQEENPDQAHLIDSTVAEGGAVSPLKLIEEAKMALQGFSKRLEQITALLGELDQDLSKVIEESQEKSYLSEMIIRLGSSAFSALTLGMPYGAAMGYSLTHVISEPGQSEPLPQKVYRWLVREEIPQRFSIGQTEIVHFQFKQSSSPFLDSLFSNWKADQLGTLYIPVGQDQCLILPVDLDQRSKIDKQGIWFLYQELDQRVKDGKMIPRDCLSILDCLESKVIERASRGDKVFGFFDVKSPAYLVIDLLKRKCNALMNP